MGSQKVTRLRKRSWEEEEEEEEEEEVDVEEEEKRVQVSKTILSVFIILIKKVANWKKINFNEKDWMVLKRFFKC